MIQHTVYEEKVVGDDRKKIKKIKQDDYETIKKVLSTLRLFKKGKFLVGIFTTQSVSSVHNSGIPSHERNLNDFSSRTEYSLNSEETSEFVKFWHLILDSKFHQSKSISTAIRRFNYAYERENSQDEIIDYLISFEALFFKNEKQELREKLSRRTARLLETEFHNRQTLSRKMKDFYDKRSSVVHGSETKITPEYVDEIQEVLRTSIKKFLNEILTQNHDDIIDHLDFD